MKILSLHVENFGGLRDYSLTLTDGVNVLLKPNGWGKSSLAVFIKAMLYGLPVSTRRSLLENERKRYTPWQGGVYGGSMDVQVGEKTLRIERTFGTKESEDTLTLTDLHTGVELPVESATSCGEAWFGVDAAAYERSTYLSQRAIDESDGNLSIHAKLNRLVDATDDIGSFDCAMEILEKQRKYYTVSGGRRGAIADDEEQLVELTAQMEACHAHHRAALACEERLAALNLRQADVRRQGQDLHEQEQQLLRAKEQQAKRQNWQQLQALANAEEKTYAQILQSLGGRLPDEAQLLALEHMEQQITELTSRQTAVAERLDAQHASVQEAAVLAALFSDDVPDQTSLQQLSHQAECAHRAQLQWQSACKESVAVDAEEVESPEGPQLEDARALQRFFMQYPSKEQQLINQCNLCAEQCRVAAQVMQSCQTVRKQNKRNMWMTIVAGLVLSVALALISPALGAIPLVVTAGVAAVLFRGRKKNATRCHEAEQAVAASVQAREQAKQQLAQLQAQWTAACRRVEKHLGIVVTDAIQAQEVLAEYQSKIAQHAAQKAARAASVQAREQRLQDLQEQAKVQAHALRALWHWGEMPDIAGAPVQVERLAQKAARYAQLRAEQQEAQEQCKQLAEQIQSVRQKRAAVLDGCEQVPENGAAVWMRERIARAEQSRRAQQEYAARAQAYAQEHDLVIAMQSDDGALSLPSQEQLAAQRECVQQQEEALYSEIARLRREMEEHMAQHATLEALESEAAEVRARCSAAKESLETVLETQKFLKQAKDQLSGRYLTKMKESFARYLSALTAQEAPAFTMDGSFAVKLRRAGVSRSQEAFSTGQRDVLSLCARLSLVDALFEGETPFLVLDDPFTNLDDQTVDRAMTLLLTAAKQYQILYLTCHSSRQALGSEIDSE